MGSPNNINSANSNLPDNMVSCISITPDVKMDWQPIIRIDYDHN